MDFQKVVFMDGSTLEVGVEGVTRIWTEADATSGRIEVLYNRTYVCHASNVDSGYEPAYSRFGTLQEATYSQHVHSKANQCEVYMITPEVIRVHSPSGAEYTVVTDDEGLLCNCKAGEAHGSVATPRCSHGLAVLRLLNKFGYYTS